MDTMKFEGVGTHWEVDILSPFSKNKWEYLQVLIQKRVDQFERTYSRFRPDSYTNIVLSQLGTHILPEDAEPLFEIYKKLYNVTKGAFTPLIGQVLIDAGYDSEYSFKEKILHTPTPLEDVMDYQYPKISIKKQQVFDFGACGKGYLIDIIGNLIKEEGGYEYCINAGGDIRYISNKPLRVGLENPSDTSQAIGISTITNTSLCASSGSRRKWGKFHHIIDPHTLASPKKVVASWTLANDTLTGDALATSLFLVSPRILTPHFSFEYLVLFADSSFEKSPGFLAELFLK